jgi:hypothetical protein
MHRRRVVHGPFFPKTTRNAVSWKNVVVVFRVVFLAFPAACASILDSVVFSTKQDEFSEPSIAPAIFPLPRSKKAASSQTALFWICRHSAVSPTVSSSLSMNTR